MKKLLVACAALCALAPLGAHADMLKDLLTDAGGPTMAGSFHIIGQAQMITPPLLSQYGVYSEDACKQLTTVSGATVGGLPLEVQVSAIPFVDASGMYPCSISLTIGGQPVPDAGPFGLGSDGKKYDGTGFNAVGIYVIGGAPYALAIVSLSEGWAANHEGDYLFQLYVIRNGKPIEVFRADSKNTLDVSVKNNVLTLGDVNRVHGGECDACTTPESMSFDIYPEAGRVHWHALTPRANESVQYWLEEADPAFRAQEVADLKAQAQATDQAFQQMEQKKTQEATSGWYILNRYNTCVSPSERPGPDSPADLIRFDLQSGVRDDVAITKRDENGDPIAVTVGEPSNGNLETTYEFYKGAANCSSAASSASNELTGLN